MKDKRYIFFVFIFCHFLFSCNDSANEIKLVSLPEVVELTSTSNTIDATLLYPAKMFIKGNKLFIFEPLEREMFKVFDFPSLVHLYSFGDRGRGPNEFATPFGNDEIIDNDTDLIEIFDSDQIKFVNISDSLPYIQSKISIPVFKMPINRLRKMNDSLYYHTNWFDGDMENEFTRLNVLTGVRTYFSPYPNWVKNLKTTDEKYLTYSKASGYSFTHKMIVAFYYHYPVVKFIDFDGKVVKEIHVNTPKSNFNIPDTENNLFFVEFFAITDNYIYVMWFEGKPKKEILDNPENFKPEMLVFDWEGNIEGRYRLDKPIAVFAISEKTNKIYGVPLPEEDVINVIYEYDLPIIKKQTTR